MVIIKILMIMLNDTQVNMNMNKLIKSYWSFTDIAMGVQKTKG